MLTVSDGYYTDDAYVWVTVTAPAPAMSNVQSVPSTTLTVGVTATAFTPVTASGGTAPYTFAIDTPLPTGLNFNTSTGEITGTPTAASTQKTYKVTVTDSTAGTPNVVSDNFDLTVNKGSQTITFPAIADSNYGFLPTGNFPRTIEMLATSDSGLGVTEYTTNDDTICKYTPYNTGNSSAGVGGIRQNIKITGVGTCVVTAAQSGNANYDAATPVQRTFNIDKGAQVIAPANGFTARNFVANETFTVSSVAVTGGGSNYGIAGSSSELAVSYTSDTPDVCSVSGTTLNPYFANPAVIYYSNAVVTVLAPGTCTLTMTQAGDEHYYAAKPVQRSITINPPALTTSVAVGSSSFPTGAPISPFTPVTATGGYGTLTFAVSPDLPAGLGFNTATGEISGTPTTATAQAQYTVKVTDSTSGTPQTSSKQFSLAVVDTIAPMVVSITRQNPTTESTDADALTWRVTFSENVKNVDALDFAVSNTTTATVTNVAPQSASTYDVTVSGGDLDNLNAKVTLSFASGQNIADLSDNALASTTPSGTNDNYFLVQNDVTAPTVEIQGAPASFGNLTPFTVTFQWSEEVTGFALGDITVGKGSASNFVKVDGDTYTADITPDGSGDVTIDVAANVAKDLAGNDNEAAKQVVVSSTIVGQTQQAISNFMTNRANGILGSDPNIFGFLDGTNNGGGGDLGNLSMNANASSMELAFSTSLSRVEEARERNLQDALTKTGKTNTDQRILAAHRAIMGLPESEVDAAANNDRRIASAFGGITGGEDTQGSEPEQRLAMAYAADTREPGDTALARLQPKNDEQQGASTHGEAGAMPANRFDMWTQVTGSASRTGDANASLWIGYVGAHYFLTPDLIVGALVQFDWADETNATAGSSADGLGWMAGPYAAGRLAGTSLIWEARAAWGRSDNTISPIGTYRDDFTTTRWLASAKIAGAFPIGTMTVKPTASVSYFEETQQGYTDSLTNAIPEQTVSLGEIRFGPEFSWDLGQADGATIRPKLGVSGVYNFNVRNGNSSQGSLLGDEDVRARFDAGLTVINALGWSFLVEGYYDGVGADGYSAYGGKARITVPFN